MSDLFLYLITILSGIVTVITGSITIIGYFKHDHISPSQQVIQPPSQYAQQTRPYAPPTQQYDQPPQPYGQTAQQFGHVIIPKKRNRLSHPRIALIALIGQILLFVTLILSLVFFSPAANPDTSGALNIYTLIAFIILILFLAGIGCALTALIMSLLKTKQLDRWGWFTSLISGFLGLFILFLPALIPLLFGIFGPKEQKGAKTQAGFD